MLFTGKILASLLIQAVWIYIAAAIVQFNPWAGLAACIVEYAAIIKASRLDETSIKESNFNKFLWIALMEPARS